MLTFVGNRQTIFQSDYHFASPPTVTGSSHGFTFCQLVELLVFYILVILIGIYGISLLFLYVVLNGICDCITLYACYIVLSIIKILLIFLRKQYKTSNDSEESV